MNFQNILYVPLLASFGLESKYEVIWNVDFVSIYEFLFQIYFIIHKNERFLTLNVDLLIPHLSLFFAKYEK